VGRQPAPGRAAAQAVADQRHAGGSRARDYLHRLALLRFHLNLILALAVNALPGLGWTLVGA
jgi:hypothetical protein